MTNQIEWHDKLVEENTVTLMLDAVPFHSWTKPLNEEKSKRTTEIITVN